MIDQPQDRRGKVMADTTTLMLLKSIKELEKKSTTDSLTGLHNRDFWEQETPILEQSKRMGYTIISIDVDGLKEINDSKGHLAGDILIKNAANILRHTFRIEDHLIRLGGDELCVIVPYDMDQFKNAYEEYLINTLDQDESKVPSMEQFIEKILTDRFNDKIAAFSNSPEAGEYQVALSFGMCTSLPNDNLTPPHNLTKAFNNADARMYLMKELHHQSVTNNI
ncbi:GGDEF domain-containing protein [Candidatus Shapirobacteria bacterium]|nr:GGDEF domain-containing protein [Candidatus Shapirobacteria bacterium]